MHLKQIAFKTLGFAGKKTMRPPHFVVFLLCLKLLSVCSQNYGTNEYRDFDYRQSVLDAYTNIPRTCDSVNPNNNFICLKEPENPGPFHDLTKFELKQLEKFLQNDPRIQAVKPSLAQINSSFVYMADLYLPPKYETLQYLDGKGQQPPRQARVMIFRGDLNPSVVQEYVCGPLPYVRNCDMLQHPNRRNPVEFSLRPFGVLDLTFVTIYLWIPLTQKVGNIFMESYNATPCDTNQVSECLEFNAQPITTSYIGSIERLVWLNVIYKVQYSVLHPVDFAVICNITGTDPGTWSLGKAWYAGQIYDSIDELVAGYNSNRIPKLRLQKPKQNARLFSSLRRRGPPQPRRPQRPPVQVEPDGKRYSVNGRKVKYLDWTFNFAMSALTGPAVFDVRFKGNRIAYEIGLAGIALFYSAFNPIVKIATYSDTGIMLGTHSKSLIPGGDCPEYATLVNQTFWGQLTDGAQSYDSSFCLFEQNNGVPLRRHSAYEKFEGSFYGGMLDSALTLRSILTLSNYDYAIDFIFHQNGVVESRFLSTGYILPSFINAKETFYGYRVENDIVGNVHYHTAHFKVDLDVGGTDNRYETLNIVRDRVPLQQNPSIIKEQTKLVRNLKKTELEAVFDFNFRAPMYHLVYSKDNRNRFNQERSYRIKMDGLAYNLFPDNVGGVRSTPWAQHQMVVTKHKDYERWSGSNYGLVDSLNPVVNFTKYYADNENIVDEDLVFWITLGLHHIPHSEDMPVTSTVAKELTFYLLPYNYFPECPSMNSRDAIYIELIDPLNSTLGVRLDRNGNSREQCVTPRITLEEVLLGNPDLALESRRVNFVF